MPTASSVPILDLTHFLNGTAAEQVAFVQSLGQGLQQTGFFRLVNSGVDPVVIQQAYRSATDFFVLPDAVKQQYEYPEAKGQGGFTRFGREHAKDAALPDLKEFWHVNRADLEAAALWPQEVPAFHPAMTQLYRQLDGCAQILLEACALYLDQPRTWLSERVVGGRTVLRIAHYPPIAADAPPGSLRAAPHEDINLITLLCEATAPGLEILTRAGDWLPIQADPGEIVVDAGDMLQNLTNGLFKSTTHRVVNSDEPHTRRLSMPFFVHPRPEVDLTPHPACIAKTGGVAHYPSLSADAYLSQRLREIGLDSSKSRTTPPED